MQIKALPSIFICFLCMFVKTFVANEKTINFGFLFIGVIVGEIPLVMFCLGNSNAKQLNGFMFGMAVMGMVSVYPDIYNIFNILKVVSKNATT